MSMPTGVGPYKSKTPCYFFSQGYCAKNDKCPFMHGAPAASAAAEAAAQHNTIRGVSGKALSSSGKPLIVLKQSGLSAPEVLFVTNERPEAMNEAHIFSSRAPASMQGVPPGLERATHPEKPASPALANGLRQSGTSKKILQKQDNCQGHPQAGDFRNQTGCQSEALWKVKPLGGGASQSFCSEEGEYSSPSNSRKSPKGLSNSPACDGQDSDGSYGESKEQRVESEGDLCTHLVKRIKMNSGLNPSRRDGAQHDLATQHCRDRRLSGHNLKENNQQQGEGIRNVVVEADFIRAKGAPFNKRSTDFPNEAPKQSFKKGQSRSFPYKEQKLDQTKAAPLPEKGIHSSSNLRSKGSISGIVKETLNFTGPKSLAQIKAEKMASASKAIGRLDPSNVIFESSSKLADRKLAVPAEGQDGATTDEKVLNTKQDDPFKHERGKSAEFEGPKPLSALLKRKRQLESGSSVKESMPRPTEVQVAESSSEMEDGEWCNHDGNPNVDTLDGTCALVSSHEDIVVSSPSNSKEEVSQGQQRLSEEAAESDTEFSDDGSKFDFEMEENAYGDEGYEIDDDDDDDDFAKKLGRVFGLSHE